MDLTQPIGHLAVGRNLLGQAMGSKGLKTRRRLIDATVSLLEDIKPHDVKIADIAAIAQTSPATFYVYFNDIDDAVLAAANEIAQATPALLSLLAHDWTADTAHDLARRFVDIYMIFWDEHRTVLRFRNLAAENGDSRFSVAREQSIFPLLNAIAKQIARAQLTSKPAKRLHAASTAGVLLAMLERVSVTAPGYRGEGGITRARALHAAAHIVAQTLCGPGTAASDIATGTCATDETA